MTDKTFTVAGVSTSDKGEDKIRFANDPMRVKVLDKNGHTNITLVELPSAMTKEEAVAFLKELDELKDNATAKNAFADWDAKLAPKPEKAPKEPKAKVERKPKEPKTAEVKPAGANAVVANSEALIRSNRIMQIRCELNDLIEAGQMNGDDFDSELEKRVAAMDAQDEADAAALLASMQADIDEANGREPEVVTEGADSDSEDDNAPY